MVFEVFLSAVLPVIHPVQRISRVDLVRVKDSGEKKIRKTRTKNKEPGRSSGAEGGVIKVSSFSASTLVDGVDVRESSLCIGETSVGRH